MKSDSACSTISMFPGKSDHHGPYVLFYSNSSFKTTTSYHQVLHYDEEEEKS